MGIFIHIVSFKIIFSINGGYGMLFNVIINVIIFLVLKWGCESIFTFVSILFKCDFKCNYFLV